MAEKDLFEELKVKAKLKSESQKNTVQISAKSSDRLRDIAQYMGLQPEVLLELMIGIHYLSIEIMFID